ncbi:MAG: DUF3488 domain-containing protein [Leptolyngbya sp. PLA1]|nr:DUF3488 domain-containing protein [Leptolyngbya sp. PLA1]
MVGGAGVGGGQMSEAAPVASVLPPFRWVLLALVLLAVSAYALAERDLLMGGVLAAACAMGWVQTEWRAGGAARGLPRWASTLILVGVLLGAGGRLLQGAPAVSAFAQFLAAVIAVKLWERRQVRDYGQVLTLSAFLLIGATLTDVSLGVGVLLVVAAPLLAAGVMMYQLLAGAARAERPEPRAPAGAFVGLSALVLGAVLPLAVLIFVAVPRGVWFRDASLGVKRAVRVTGFGDEIDLTRAGPIRTSGRWVMNVRLTQGRAGRVLGGVGEHYHMRGAVLTRYEGSRWTEGEPSGSGTAVALETGQFVRISPDEPGGREVVQEVTAEAGPRVTVPLFMLLRPVSLEFGALERTVHVNVDHSAWTAERLGGEGTLTYRVLSIPMEAPPEEPGEPERRGPAGRAVRAAREIAWAQLRAAEMEPDPAVRPRGEDALAVRKLEAFLRLNYTYTLDGPATPLGVEPIDFFLEESRTGHCEHFASALAMMCRSIGVEARVVTGYLLSEFDADAGHYIVRDSHAHAWVEACVAPGVWRTFDATPPAEISRLAARQTSLLGRLSRLMDRAEESWNTSVVGFDRSQQLRLLGGEPGRGGVVEQAAGWLRGDGARERTRPGRVLGWAGGAVVVSVGLVWLWQVLRRRRRRAGEAHAGWGLPEDLRRDYDRLLRELSRRGESKPEWMPLSAFAREVASRDPEVGALVLEAALVVDAAAFGREGPARDADRSRVRAASRALRRLRR